jgi:transketolase
MDLNDYYFINFVKILSMDMIEEAKSGHPGMALGCAPVLYFLFQKMNFVSEYPEWLNRDRFILSNGHGSALLYSMLFLYGYNYSINDLINFRKLNSITPGHPEKNIKLGVEVTTGPLGQGISNGVGMAIASKILSTRFNNDEILFNNKVFVMCGDGCLMEGIANESISLAGTLCLDNLVLLYDDNNITIDGNTDITFTDNTKMKFESMGWDVCTILNANIDYNDIQNKINYAISCKKPCLIIMKTIIAYDTDKENSEKSHGAPLGEKSVQKLKEKYNFDPNEKFHITEQVIKFMREQKNKQNEIYKNWEERLKNYTMNNKDLNNDLHFFLKSSIEDKTRYNYNFQEFMKISKKEKVSTRKLSGMMLEKLSNSSHMIFGSADLSTSNCIPIKNVINKDNYSGNYIHFGVREHAMCGIANGLETYGFTPIVGTFLVFSSYCYPSIRLAALSNHKVIYIFSHDSLALGEDGPTHQPIETLTNLRALPNLNTFRPADRNELLISYQKALQSSGPSCICLSRQDLPNLDNYTSLDNAVKGGYIVYQSDSQQEVDLILIATGSELHLCLDVAFELSINIRVVSMVCSEIYDLQNNEYKNYILPNNITKISVEAGATIGWYKYANITYGIDSYGASGKGDKVMEYYGFSKKKLGDFIMKYKFYKPN